ncbi:MAG: PDZ domain-containing protein [Nitrososphaeria archaeon]
MNYEIAEAMDVNVTYGWLIQAVASGGPAERAGLIGGSRRVKVAGNDILLGGNIIIAINGTQIINGDDLSAYLERYTLPGQTVNITILRNRQVMDVQVSLGTRPSSGS